MEDEDRNLTRKEVEKLRDIIGRDEKAAWFWSTVRVWAMWVTAVLVAGSLMIDFLKQAVKALGK